MKSLSEFTDRLAARWHRRSQESGTFVSVDQLGGIEDMRAVTEVTVVNFQTREKLGPMQPEHAKTLAQMQSRGSKPGKQQTFIEDTVIPSLAEKTSFYTRIVTSLFDRGPDAAKKTLIKRSRQKPPPSSIA